MANFKYLSICLLLTFLCCQCQKEEELSPSLVVEGWIAQDKYPIVMLHQSYVISSDLKETASFASILEDQLIIFGKVTISDGENQIVLRGKVDTNYMPPYIYTTLDMVGEVGKTYSIHVEYEPYDLWAQSTIQPSTPLDSIQIKVTDSLSTKVWIYMSHIPNEPTYYAIFSREIGVPQYRLCPLGVFTSEHADKGCIRWLVKKPINILGMKLEDVGRSYPRDTIATSHFLRVVQLSKSEYDYWSAYDSQILTQGIFFTNVYSNLPTALPNAYGYWQGWGGQEYEFTTHKDSTFVYQRL